MFDTLEMRWFFDRLPLDLSRPLSEHVEVQERTDWYCMPCNPRCGIKVREGKLEAKLQTGSLGLRQFPPLAGKLEVWSKWSLDFPPGAPPATAGLLAVGWLPVTKRRHLERFELEGIDVRTTNSRPENGCEFEMTELTVESRRYWTVGFEAVGRADLLEQNLERTVRFIIARDGLNEAFSCTNSFGYAQWLAQLHVRHRV
jgi:hypothetical protein